MGGGGGGGGGKSLATRPWLLPSRGGERRSGHETRAWGGGGGGERTRSRAQTSTSTRDAALKIFDVDVIVVQS